MKLKQIISLIIVIAGLAGAGVFGYMAILGDKSPEQTTVSTSTVEILPKGSKLDFIKVNKFNKNGKIFRYPAVTTSEVGLELNNVMLKGTAKPQQ